MSFDSMIPDLGKKTNGAAAPNGWIKDGDTASFMDDVIQASMQQPVIVDFWANWCGPCKQLGPVLEKSVTEAKGAVRLVKIDVDRNQELAGQMRIQSIPAVYAFYQGRPVDGFVGAVPESQIKQFVQQLTKLGGGAPGAQASEELLKQADDALAAGDAGTASALYGQVLATDTAQPRAIAGLARCYLAAGDAAQAQEILDHLEPDMAKDPAIQSAKAAIDLALAAGAKTAALPALEEKVAHDPNDHQARYDLALALFGAGAREAAIDALLEIVRRQRAWNDEAARKQLVTFFEAMGPTDPLTVAGRRRLSSILFA